MIFIQQINDHQHLHRLVNRDENLFFIDILSVQVTPKEFTEQTRHRLLRLLGSSTDQPAVLERSLSSSSSSSSSFSSSSSSSTNSIIEVQGEKNSFSNGRSRSEPPISNGK